MPPGSTTSSELTENTGPLYTFLEETTFAIGFLEDVLGMYELYTNPAMQSRARGTRLGLFSPDMLPA